jgi:hypothetical protein
MRINARKNTNNVRCLEYIDATIIGHVDNAASIRRCACGESDHGTQGSEVETLQIVDQRY